MNKYDISKDDWNSPINILYNKITSIFVWPLQSENYVSHVINISKDCSNTFHSFMPLHANGTN